MNVVAGRMRMASLIVGLALLVAGCAAGAAHASGVEVFVGYADSDRASASHFPTPWAGAAGVTFDGCTPAQSCVFDGGAVRFVNSTAKAVTIEQIRVEVSTCQFELWKAHQLTAGQQLIVAQTVSGAGEGCSAEGKMDTSDVGPGGVPYAHDCDPDGVKPEVQAKINGAVSAFSDGGQIIDTGGFDLADCPRLSNESTNWVPIGRPRCAESHLLLKPTTQTHLIGGKATVVATFSCEDGEPLSGASVNFEAVAGPNAGTHGAGTTNGAGEASFSYSSGKSGTDELRATASNPAGTIASNGVEVNWVGTFAPAGGAFVISDRHSSLGTNVTFWGAKWWSLNSLTSPPGAASFKGFALKPTNPTCGAAWSAAPGDSGSPPPAPLPEYMPLIVTDSVSKSGPRISSAIAHIVVVKTNPGYAPDPGHAGTGTVVGQVC